MSPSSTILRPHTARHEASAASTAPCPPSSSQPRRSSETITECPEVALRTAEVFIRDSKRPAGLRLNISAEVWSRFRGRRLEHDIGVIAAPQSP
ncbi:DUF397 domain-containing protein [Streptomyces sp. NPDC127079]|uniref:DUF397 domain-containing protein n=1 Tax=Streptomyces sp. NPDC127079 TaxID=3347132 RepID=UPI00364D9BD1